MASIRKRGSKWQAQVRSVGHPSVSRTFRHKADARAWGRHTETEIDRAGLPISRRTLRALTIKEIATRYRNEVVPKKRGRAIETFILDAFSRQRISEATLAEATPSLFSSYRDERLRTVKPATIRRELGVLQHMFSVARREWGIPLVTNPVKAISKPAHDKPRDRRLEGDEFDRLMKASSKSRNKLIQPVIRFAIETGMRRGELLSVVWGGVTLDKRTLHIEHTKNGHPRTIPLSPEAVRILSQLVHTDGRVFPTTASAVRQAWVRICKRAGIEDLHFHDLRHEAISRLFEKGLSIPEVALISGHRDYRQLFRYVHLRAEDLVTKL